MTDRYLGIWMAFFLLFAVNFGQAQQVSLQTELEKMHRYPAIYLDPGAAALSIHTLQEQAEIQGQSIYLADPVKHLAFFCRLEVMSDRKTRIPVRVRLGTVDYVDMLERKRPGALFFTEGQTGNPHRQFAPR